MRARIRCQLLFRQFLPGLLADDVVGVPVRPAFVVMADPLFLLAMRSAARRSALASSLDEANVVSPSTRPGNRPVTCCISQAFPSGSLNVASEP
jgi:hypothetical protein